MIQSPVLGMLVYYLVFEQADFGTLKRILVKQGSIISFDETNILLGIPSFFGFQMELCPKNICFASKDDIYKVF